MPWLGIVFYKMLYAIFRGSPYWLLSRFSHLADHLYVRGNIWLSASSIKDLWGHEENDLKGILFE